MVLEDQPTSLRAFSVSSFAHLFFIIHQFVRDWFLMSVRRCPAKLFITWKCHSESIGNARSYFRLFYSKSLRAFCEPMSYTFIRSPKTNPPVQSTSTSKSIELAVTFLGEDELQSGIRHQRRQSYFHEHRHRAIC